MFKRIDHIEIIPRDVGVTLDFYTRIFHFTVKDRKKVDAPPLEEVIYLELHDSLIELLSVKNPSSPSDAPWQIGYRMMAIEVEDMDAAITYLKNNGIEPSSGPVTLGNSRRAEIKDPDGLPIELRQW